jgi:hypothetical protein
MKNVSCKSKDLKNGTAFVAGGSYKGNVKKYAKIYF